MSQFEPKSLPFGIAINRNLNALDVPRRCNDAYVVAGVICDLQDLCRGRAVGFWLKQLSEKCGWGPNNFRRINAALKFLIDNGHLDAELPPGGSRKQALFKLKVTQQTIDPRQNDVDENQPSPVTDGLQNGDCGASESSPSVSKMESDGLQNGGRRSPKWRPSNPVLCNPVLCNPDTPPLPPGLGEVNGGSFALDGTKPTAKTRTAKAIKVDDVTAIPIPATLINAEFLAAWQEWQQHLREKRKPLKATAARKQLAKLGSLGAATAVDWISYAIEHNWQGLYPPPRGNSQHGKAHLSGLVEFLEDSTPMFGGILDRLTNGHQ